MADNNSISVELVPQELLNRLQELSKCIDLVYESNKKLLSQTGEVIKSKKSLGDQVEDLNKKNQDLTEKQKNYQAEQDNLIHLASQYNTTLKEANKIAQAQNILNSESAGYIKKLTAEMNLLTIQRNNLNKADGDYSNKVDALNKKLNALGKEHESLMSAREKDKINVGRYSEAIGGLIPGLDGVMNKIISVGKTTLEGFKNAGSSVIKFAGSFNTAGGAAQAFGAITKAAMIGTGIGAIVIAIAALYEYFTKTEKGAKALREATAALGAIFNVLTGLLAKAGELLVDLFTKPVESIKKLGQFIEENIMNRIKAFGVIGKAIVEIFSKDFEKGFKDLANGIIQETTGITNVIDKVSEGAKKIAEECGSAAKVAKDLAAREFALHQASRNALMEESKAQNELIKLREVGMDKTKTSKEREEAYVKVLELENKIAESQRKIAVENLSILMAKSAERAKAGIKDSEEEKDAIAEAQRKLIDIDTDRVHRGIRMESQLHSLKAEDIEKEQQLIEKQTKFTESIQEKAALTEREKLELEYQQKLEEAKKLGVDTLAVEQWKATEINKIEDKENENNYKANQETQKKILETDKKANEETLKERKKLEKESEELLKSGMKLFNDLYENQINKIESTLQTQLSALDKEKETRIANGENEKKVDADIAAKKIALEHASAIKEAEIKRKQAIMDKTFAIFEIAIKTAENINNNIDDPVMLALAIATGALEEAAVIAKPIPAIPKFKSGVKGFEGGMAMLHGGELVSVPGNMYITPGGVNDPIPSLLPKGTDVIPNSILMEDLRNLTLKSNLTGRSDDSIQAIKELAQAYKNKKEVHVNIDEHGMQIFTRQALKQTQWINKYRQ